MAVSSQHKDERGDALSALAARFGDALSTADAVRRAHGHDESYHAAALPDAVLLTNRRDDVIDAVRLCHEHRLPIVAYGTGTGLEGNVNAVYGGLCVGVGKIDYMEAEHGDAVDVMWQLKKALDPRNILNPGKILPVHGGLPAGPLGHH